jgi:hypothetical protein
VDRVAVQAGCEVNGSNGAARGSGAELTSNPTPLTSMFRD